MKKKVVILGGARTPMAEWVGGKTGDGRNGGALASVSAIDLGVVAARGALEKTNVGAEKIGHVVMGNVLQTSGDAIYGARHVGLKAGVDPSTPCLTVNRICGSGIQSIVDGMFLVGEGLEYALTGGMESMSQAPHVIRGARSGLKLGRGKLEDTLMVALMDPYCGLYMAQTAEKLARRFEISREDQDAFALESTHRAEKAWAEGWFDDEIVGVETGKGKRKKMVERDDHYFVKATIEGLGALRPAFGEDGFVTAGNASGMVDGAACVVIADEAAAARDGYAPMAEIVDWHAVGVDPSEMGIGPVPAIRGLLDKCGMRLEQVDRFEINEAFSAQYLAVERDLGLDRSKVNVNGGAIGLGHPLGATGTRLVLTLARELKRSNLAHGVASACIGGGQGIAILIKNCAA